MNGSSNSNEAQFHVTSDAKGTPHILFSLGPIHFWRLKYTTDKGNDTRKLAVFIFHDLFHDLDQFGDQ